MLVPFSLDLLHTLSRFILLFCLYYPFPLSSFSSTFYSLEFIKIHTLVLRVCNCFLRDQRSNPTRNLEKLGKKMVGGCRGLPHAVVALSWLLLHKKSYWSKVNNHIWRHLKGNSGNTWRPSLWRLKKYYACVIVTCLMARFPEEHKDDLVIDCRGICLRSWQIRWATDGGSGYLDEDDLTWFDRNNNFF